MVTSQSVRCNDLIRFSSRKLTTVSTSVATNVPFICPHQTTAEKHCQQRQANKTIVAVAITGETITTTAVKYYGIKDG